MVVVLFAVIVLNFNQFYRAVRMPNLCYLLWCWVCF